MMAIVDVLEVMNYPKEELDFLKDFINSLETFRDCIPRAHPNFSSYRQTILIIQNTDLWIDANIENHPLLWDFREYVTKEMAALGIPKHPPYIYKEHNQFKK